MGGFERTTFRFESDNTDHCATESETCVVKQSTFFFYLLPVRKRLITANDASPSALNLVELSTFPLFVTGPSMKYVSWR